MIMWCTDQPLYLLVMCLTRALCQDLFLVSKKCVPYLALWHHIVVAEGTVHVCTGDFHSRYIILAVKLLKDRTVKGCCYP